MAASTCVMHFPEVKIMSVFDPLLLPQGVFLKVVLKVQGFSLFRLM